MGEGGGDTGNRSPTRLFCFFLSTFSVKTSHTFVDFLSCSFFFHLSFSIFMLFKLIWILFVRPSVYAEHVCGSDVHFVEPLSCKYVFPYVSCSCFLVYLKVYTELCSRGIFLSLTRGNNFHVSVITGHMVFIGSAMKQVLGLLRSVIFHNSPKVMWMYLVPAIIGPNIVGKWNLLKFPYVQRTFKVCEQFMSGLCNYLLILNKIAPI